MITMMWPKTMSSVCAIHVPSPAKKLVVVTSWSATRFVAVRMLVVIRMPVPQMHRKKMIRLAIVERHVSSESAYCKFSHSTSSGSGARVTRRFPPNSEENLAPPARRRSCAANADCAAAARLKVT